MLSIVVQQCCTTSGTKRKGLAPYEQFYVYFLL
eukprot:SAG31_NODE_24372_length_483_cov_0.585938_1_plen_32_part_01